MNILVSACLLGVPCRYDGKSKPCESVIKLKEKHRLIPVCPEVAGTLPTPRPPCEIVGDKVKNSRGEDKTREYTLGAKRALKLYKKFNCSLCILKEKSPSCSVKKIYDGSFSKTLIDGKGITGRLFLENNIKVLGESEIEEILND
jgi:uncharacterized protein YbbK (DUF523 family)